MEVIIFIGIQASGKSSFYRDRFFTSHVRVSLDLLKTRHREKKFIETCLETQQPFVVDNTNPTATDRAVYIEKAKASGFRVVGYYFQSRIEESLKRNAERSEAQQIPDKGIRGTHAKLEMPKLAEGFDELFYVSLLEGGGFEVKEWNDEV